MAELKPALRDGRRLTQEIAEPTGVFVDLAKNLLEPVRCRCVRWTDVRRTGRRHGDARSDAVLKLGERFTGRQKRPSHVAAGLCGYHKPESADEGRFACRQATRVENIVTRALQPKEGHKGLDELVRLGEDFGVRPFSLGIGWISICSGHTLFSGFEQVMSLMGKRFRAAYRCKYGLPGSGIKLVLLKMSVSSSLENKCGASRRNAFGVTSESIAYFVELIQAALDVHIRSDSEKLHLLGRAYITGGEG